MKENNVCSVVRDLMPSYLDMLTGEKSSQLVRSHMEECPKCKKQYLKLLELQEEEQELEKFRSNKMKRMLKRYRYEMLGLILGNALTLATIGVFILGLSQGFFGEKRIEEHTENVNDYGKQKQYAGNSDLSLFPDKDIEKEHILKYTYHCSGNELYQQYEIYLECQYSEDEFLKEKSRLLAIKNEETQKTVKYNKNEFIYPCVYAMLYDNFEYALLDEKVRKVYYIYLQGMDRRDMTVDLAYLPKDYGQSGYSMETEREGYNMYPPKNTLTDSK